MTSLALSLQAQALRLQNSLGGRRPSSAPSLGRPTPSACSLSSSHWMRGSALQRRGEGHSQAPRARGALRVQALFEKFTVRVGGPGRGGVCLQRPLTEGMIGGGAASSRLRPVLACNFPRPPCSRWPRAGAQHQVGHACAGGGTADERNRGAGRGAHPAALWAPALASGQTWQTLSVRPHRCPAGPPAGLHGAHPAGADCRGLWQGRLPGLRPHGGWPPSVLHSLAPMPPGAESTACQPCSSTGLAPLPTRPLISTSPRHPVCLSPFARSLHLQIEKARHEVDIVIGRGRRDAPKDLPFRWAASAVHRCMMQHCSLLHHAALSV